MLQTQIWNKIGIMIMALLKQELHHMSHEESFSVYLDLRISERYVNPT